MGSSDSIPESTIAAPTKLRWGIVGTARTAEKRTLPAMVGAGHEIVAIAGRSAVRTGQFANKFGIRNQYTGANFGDILDDPDIDSIYIPLPSSHHAGYAARALRAGKHVLVEKPMALSRTELSLIEAAARDTGLVIEEYFPYARSPAFCSLIDTVQNNEIGHLSRIEVTFSFPANELHAIRFDKHLAGGSFIDLGCYALDFVHRLVGEELTCYGVVVVKPSGVQVEWGTGRTAPIDARCAWFGRSASNVAVTINTSFDDPAEQSVLLCGDDGIQITCGLFATQGVASEMLFAPRRAAVRAKRFEPFDGDLCEILAFAESVRVGAATSTDVIDRRRRTADALCNGIELVSDSLRHNRRTHMRP